MTNAANELLNVLRSLGESASFCTGGNVAPVLPGLEVTGIGEVGVPVSAAAARRLIDRAAPAPYGRGEATIVDTSVRRVWQLEPRQFSLANAEWEPFIAGIVGTVSREFGITQKVEHELYKLLVYEKGSFFAAHRDSEKTPRMFATLVVCLPSKHAGGTLVVTHDGQTQRIDFGGNNAHFRVQYAAFYADCQHEITPVASGYRVCLVYNLAIARKRQPSAPASSGAVMAVTELLPKIFADESLDKIAIPLKHQYTEPALDPSELKGADRTRVDVLVRAAERLDYQVYLALLEHRQSGSVDESSLDYSPRSRRRRYYRDDDDGDDISDEKPGAEFEEVFDESLTLDFWLDAQGRKPSFGEMKLLEREILRDVEPEGRPYAQEISEATGNEGASMERWYRQGVVVIWPRDRYFGILAGEGQASAIPALEAMVATIDEPAADDGCRVFATEIVKRWQTVQRHPSHGDRPKVGTSLTTRMLQLLDKIGAGELAVRFARDILPTSCDGTEGSALGRLAGRVGWPDVAAPLVAIFRKQAPEDGSCSLQTPVSLFEALCCSPPALTDQRRAVCARLAETIERHVESWDRSTGHAWYRQEESRAGIVKSVFRGLSALGDTDRLDRFVAHVLADPKRYDLHAVLIPDVKAIHSTTVRYPAGQVGFARLREHCLTELGTLTATRPEPPQDWTRDADIDCKCADCRELVAFLRSPTEQVHRWPRRNDLRQHLHSQIDRHRCDLTHVTDHRGSPHTLVCTKTQTTYQRRLAQFGIDTQRLGELRLLSASPAVPMIRSRAAPMVRGHSLRNGLVRLDDENAREAPGRRKHRNGAKV